MSAPKHRKQLGLTLVETLVALAVMGLVAASVLTLIGQNTRFASDARERMYAEIALDNIMVETLALSDTLSDQDTGEISVAGRNFTWTRTITQTGIGGVRRIDVSVNAPGGAQTLARATTLRGAP